MQLSRDDVAKVGLLARLRLTDEELEQYTKQLNAIVGYVEQFQELGTEGVEELAHGIDVRNIFRDDASTPMLTTEQAMQNAPQRNREAFLVPAALESGSTEH